ncbi:MAG: hypothetical protein WC856_24055 [Methylococcaceae bacterium]|jgi:hypothetical protein
MSALAFDNPPPVANLAAAYLRGVFSAEYGLPSPAIAATAAVKTTAPTFNRNEQIGLCLIESTVSLLAARTNDFQCNKASYDLQVFTTDPNNGVAEIDYGVGVGGTTLNARLGPNNGIGTRCKVDEASGVNLLKTLQVADYNGDHGWSRTNEIFNSDAYISIVDRQTSSTNLYREVDIKDFFKRVINGRSWEFDVGLEDIKKFRDSAVIPGDSVSPNFYYPVQKWGELSWYRHENGGEGGLWVKKLLVIPRSAVGCKIEVEAYDLTNQSGEFEMAATVKVGR